MRELAIWMDGRQLGTLDGSDSRILREILAPLADSILTEEEAKAATHIINSIGSWATSRLLQF
jgi:hypothetical protein